nr:integrase, catalytic region, zinc finger, CCHC-type, peptidase aspartic, catalytic [Tanacetum cinerariifolium]
MADNGSQCSPSQKGTEVMKDKVSQEHICKEEVPLNNNITKLSGDLAEMPSEAVEQRMDVPNELDGVKGKKVPNHVGKKDNTKTRRPQPRSNTKNDRVPSASTSSCNKNKGVEVEEHHRNLLLSKNKKHMSSVCNNIKLDSQNVISKVVYAMWQFCYSDLEVAFRRNTCFVRNLEGVDLLKGNRTTNLYTINLHDIASASPICLMARASSTKSWLWHQRLSHLNFDTINDAKKILSQVLQSSNIIRNIFVIHSPVIIIRTDNGTKFKNQVLKEYFDSVGISHQVSSVRTPQQNGLLERRNQTLVEAARTMLIFSRALLFLWTEAIATACFTQNCSIIHHLLFEAMYDDFIGGQPSAAQRTVLAAQAQQNVKEAMNDPAWIESMQEELLQFKRLDVWVLFPASDNISPLTLKWLFKNKYGEEQTVIRNKS